MASTGAFGYWRTTGRPIVFPAKAVVLATGGIGKAYEVTSNSWEYSGDGQALAYDAGAELIDMEFVQFHPTGMVWPPGVRGLLVTEAVRGEGGILRNATGERFMWKYLPEERRARVRRDRRGGRPLGDGPVRRASETDARRPPELSTRDNVARAIYTEVKEGRGSPHGGVYLDISYLPAEHVRRKLPSMYEQFKELADVDITTGPMEVGPTTHYVMGGIRVDAETGATTVAGPVRGRRGRRRHARREPPRRQLAVRPARLRGAGRGERGGRAAATDGEPHLDPVQVQAAARDLAAPLERTERRGSVRDPARPAGDDAAPGRHLPRARRTSTRPSRELAELRRRWRTSGRPGAGRSTPAGTSCSSSATC